MDLTASLVQGSIPVLAAVIGTGFGLWIKDKARSQVDEAKKEAQELVEGARREAQERTREIIRGELAQAFMSFKDNLNGTYVRTPLFEDHIKGVDQQFGMMRRLLLARPCLLGNKGDCPEE